MEVGCSVEFHIKGTVLLVHNWSSPSIFGLYFPSSYSWNKAKLSVSSPWWPLNGEDTNGRTLVETAKRWLQLQLLVRGGSLIPSYLIVRDFDYWTLNRRWQLKGGSTVYQPPASVIHTHSLLSTAVHPFKGTYRYLKLHSVVPTHSQLHQARFTFTSF